MTQGPWKWCQTAEFRDFVLYTCPINFYFLHIGDLFFLLFRSFVFPKITSPSNFNSRQIKYYQFALTSITDLKTQNCIRNYLYKLILLKKFITLLCIRILCRSTLAFSILVSVPWICFLIPSNSLFTAPTSRRHY